MSVAGAGRGRGQVRLAIGVARDPRGGLIEPLARQRGARDAGEEREERRFPDLLHVEVTRRRWKGSALS